VESSSAAGAPYAGGKELAAAAEAAGRALGRLSEALDRRHEPVRSGGNLDQASALAALREENRQLREALESRGSIERAKGVLMAHHNCSEHDAFSILVTLARREQRKVRVIADELLGSLAVLPEPRSVP
jgi:hypothetical protein